MSLLDDQMWSLQVTIMLKITVSITQKVFNVCLLNLCLITLQLLNTQILTNALHFIKKKPEKLMEITASNSVIAAVHVCAVPDMPVIPL